MTRFYERLEKNVASRPVTSIHYATAVGVVAVGGLCRAGAQPLIGDGYAFLFFYPAVLLAAWFGGIWPGLLATVLSAALALAGWLRPWETNGLPLLRILFPLVVFLCSGVLFSFLMDMMNHIVRKQRLLHKELYAQHEWFRVTLTSIGDAVIVTDRNGELSFMNPEAERMTGWNFPETRGKSLRVVFRIINEETRKSVEDPVEKVFRERRVVGLANHTLLISKDGAECPIEDSAAPIYDEEKNIIGVVLVFHDATELRRSQRILKTHATELEHKVFERTLSLQRTINDLEAFSYTVSHDLRAPLRAMQGYATTLLEDFADTMADEAKDYLQRIQRAAFRLDRLTQDLLTFSRLTSEEETLGPIDLDRLVREIIQQYPDLQVHQDRIRIDGRLPQVLGHGSALTQVIANLLGNAVKFVAGENSPEVLIRAETKEHVVRFWFIDNGIGIAPENQERIFKMFEQINSPGKYGGTGVGLALVRKAVDKMQGAVGVESVPGEGSRFWVELIRVKNT